LWRYPVDIEYPKKTRKDRGIAKKIVRRSVFPMYKRSRLVTLSNTQSIFIKTSTRNSRIFLGMEMLIPKDILTVELWF